MVQVFVTGCQNDNRVVSGIDWSKPGKLKRIDPYLLWLDITSGQALEGAPKEPVVNVLLELSKALLSASGTAMASQMTGTRDSLIPTHSRYLVPTVHRFVGLNMPLSNLAALLAEVQSASPAICRFELMGAHSTGDGHQEIDAPAQNPLDFSIGSVADLIQLVRARVVQTKCPLSVHEPFVPEQSATKLPMPKRPGNGNEYCSTSIPTPLIGVVDDGCNLAAYMAQSEHASLTQLWHQEHGGGPFKRRRDCVLPGNKTRGHAMTDDVPIWKSPVLNQDGTARRPGSRFGQRLELQKLKDAGLVGTAEVEVYRQVHYMYPTMAWTHGASMLDVALRGPRPVSRLCGTAPAVEAVFVQLPPDAVEDTAGGLLSAHALDGIHDILYIAASSQGEGDPARPVVVNLSYGTHGGAHDGTSMFESALLELLNCNTNLHVVLPAGNSHVLRCHASGWLTQSQPSRKLRWKVVPDNPSDSFLEIWIHDITATPTIKVTSPNGDIMRAKIDEAFVLSKGHPFKVAPFGTADGQGTKHKPGDPIEAALIYPPSVAQGDRGTMILVAVAPTRRREGSRLSNVAHADRVPMKGAHGVWEVELHSANGQATRFEAWIQRDDVAPGSRRARRGAVGRQSYFLDDEQCGAEPRITLNGIGTVSHDRLWVVGAMRASDGGVSTYSASGPNVVDGSRLDGPNAVVAVDQSRNSPGASVGAVFGGSRRRVSGTSLAAARFSRMLVDHLAQGKSSDCFVWPHPSGPAPVDRVPAGAPKEADPMSRGEHNRMQEARDASQRGAPQSNLAADAKLPPDR